MKISNYYEVLYKVQKSMRQRERANNLIGKTITVNYKGQELTGRCCGTDITKGQSRGCYLLIVPEGKGLGDRISIPLEDYIKD